MLRQPGPGPGQAGTRVTLRIANVPSFLSEDDVGRVFKGMGALSIRRAGAYMYAEFGDLITAQKCKSAYDGWQGWGMPGLAIEVDASAGISYDPEYSKQPQLAAPSGVYAQQQAQQQQSAARAQAAPPGTSMQAMAASGVRPAGAAPAGSAASTGTAAAGGSAGGGTGLAAALAGLSPSQLSSLAGLLGQAVGQPAKPQAPAAQPQQPAPAQAPAVPAQAPVQADAGTQQQYNPTSQLLGSLTAPGGLLSSLQGAGTASAGGAAAATGPLAAALQQLTANAQQQTQAAQLAANPLLSLLGLPGQQQPNLAATLPQLLAALPAAAQLSALPQLSALLQLQSSAAPPAAPAAPAPAPAQPSVTIVPQNPPGPSPPPGAPPAQPRPGGPPPGPDGAPLPPNATATLFFNGLPLDMTKREAAHIFRPIQGYKDLRLLVREHPHRPGERSTNLFVDFVDVHAATAAMHLLAGYKLDLDDDASATMEPKYGRPMPARAQAHADRTHTGPAHDGRGPPQADFRGGPPVSGQAAPSYAGVPPGYGAPAAYGGAPTAPMTRVVHDQRRGGPTDDRGRDRERERDTRDTRDRERDRDRRDQRPDDNRSGRARSRWQQ